MRPLITITLCLLAFAASAQTYYYQCTDPRGQPIFSERPCGDDAEEKTISSATGTQDITADAEPGDVCSTIAGLAEAIMKGRQKGADITTMYAVADRQAGPWRTMSRQLVTEAYSSPRFSTSKHQVRSISEFKASAMVDCVKTNQ